ncbi:hypothetical protein Hdeb2414_s0004g00139251 [Helianthus debilis subsp. tardiflorus]
MSKIGITKEPAEWVEKFVSALPKEEWEDYILNLKSSGEFSQLTISPLVERIEEQMRINDEKKKNQNGDQRSKEEKASKVGESVKNASVRSQCSKAKFSRIEEGVSPSQTML